MSLLPATVAAPSTEAASPAWPWPPMPSSSLRTECAIAAPARDESMFLKSCGERGVGDVQSFKGAVGSQCTPYLAAGMLRW